MATLKSNSIIKGFKGKIGNLVLREDRGKMILASKPDNNKKKQSESQRILRLRFKKAAAYSKAAMQSEERKIFYKEIARKLNLSNAYTAAVKHFLLTTEGSEIDMEEFKQYVDQLVLKKKQVKSEPFKNVTVKVLNDEGELLQHGIAIEKEGEWHFKLLKQIAGTTITIVMKEERSE